MLITAMPELAPGFTATPEMSTPLVPNASVSWGPHILSVLTHHQRVATPIRMDATA